MVDIEKIMQEIREEIKEKGLDKELPAFESGAPIRCGAVYECFDEDYFYENVEQMNQTCLIQPDRPIAGNPIAVLIKKTIRKLTRFYIAPAFCDQSQFNVAAVKAMNSLRYYIDEDRKSKARIDELAKRVEELEKRLESRGRE